MMKKWNVHWPRAALLMLAASATGSGALQQAARAATAPSVAAADVKDFGAKCDGRTLDTLAFQRAIDAARVVSIPSGTCVIASVTLHANTTIVGKGAASILRQSGSGLGMLRADSGSPNAGANIGGIVVRDLQLRGTVEVDGFAEHVHLLALSGVSDVLIERVLFKGFRGDGLYLGSSQSAGVERHNRHVMVRQSVFDGINNDNRNGISIIDGEDVTIQNNQFRNITRPNMPGAIDAEPDGGAYPVIRDIVIRNNSFAHIGGGVGVVSIVVPPSVARAAKNVTVEHNVSSDYIGSGSFVFFDDHRAATAASEANNLQVIKNVASKGAKPFLVFGKGITIGDNVFTDFTASAYLAYVEGYSVRDVELVNNRFIRVGSVSGVGLAVFKADYLTIAGNLFVDNGAGIPGASTAVDFDAGASSHVTFDGNQFSSPRGKTAVAIQREGAHRFAPATNKFYRNDLAGLSNNFSAHQSDTLDAAGSR